MRRVEYINAPRKKDATLPKEFSREATAEVRAFHQSIPGYEVTPLACLKDYAAENGVKAVFVKDESKRFGLKAFKGLGGSYAIAKLVAEKLGLDLNKVTLEDLKAPEIHEKIKDMVFVTATDGNHGKGVSWTAGILGCKSYVFMPKGSVEVRAQAIRDVGTADVTITDMGYDDTVRHAAKLAEENGWYLVQDTSWDGYESIPTHIGQGYTTMIFEALDQMKEAGFEKPTHIFLQAGVGAMAGSVLGAVACEYVGDHPVASIVEPVEVACIYESVQAGDGLAHKATGSEITIMAGLNCGEPCEITWPVLRDHGDFYFAVEDSVAEEGMRGLAHPVGNDPIVVSGESGAATFGFIREAIEHRPDLREMLGIDENSVLLAISTEGATDPENYKKVVGIDALE